VSTTSKHADKSRAFQKVGECLYRYTSNGVYYARIKTDGKEIRQSLRTIDRQTANRELAALKRKHITLAELCDRYIKTVQHEGQKTVNQKERVAKRIKEHWPGGSIVQVGKIKPSDVDTWLGRYSFGAASRSFHIQVVKDLFNLALRDKIISDSPAAHLRYIKRAKPIRKTPNV
jgi:hypothetical protein